jgi:hypothetical protein
VPYGIWTTADESEILFNRRYKLICRRNPDASVVLEDPNRWVDNIARETWFYTDKTPLSARRQIVRKVLKSWGVETGA